MKFWLSVLIFLIGVALGIVGTLLAPEFIGPYLPEAIQGKAELVEGKVVAKQREPDRLLLTVLTPQGAILVTFKKKVPEINLLVEQGDTVTLDLRQYKPFVEDPAIKRVRKERPRGRTKESEPSPLPTEEEKGEIHQKEPDQSPSPAATEEEKGLEEKTPQSSTPPARQGMLGEKGSRILITIACLHPRSPGSPESRKTFWGDIYGAFGKHSS